MEGMSAADIAVANEQIIFQRLARRIRAAIARPAKRNFDSEYFLTDSEDFWERHLDDLVRDALELGVTRMQGLAPFGSLLAEAFSDARAVVAGYVHLAGYVNDLALSRWMPARPNAAAKIQALCQLHARSLTLLEEIVLLSTSGYPAGVLALARTMHEVRVTARFLHRFSSELSIRYLDSHIVDLWKSRADWLPSGSRRRSREWLAIVEEVESRYREVISQHGESMLIQNGWAMPRFAGKKLGRSGKPPQRITFEQIEQQVRKRGDRERYRAASKFVHATQIGTIGSLRAMEPDVALLGPRPFNLDRGASQALWDVQDVTESLLRSCGRVADDESIWYWLAALEQLSYVVRGLLSDGQNRVDVVFADQAGAAGKA